MLADENGDPAPVYSNASGLDYPAAGPEHALLHKMDRVKYTTVDDDDAIEALFLLSRHEGIIPAIESSHALAYAIRVARTGATGSILVNLSGRGDKDLDFVVEKYGPVPGVTIIIKCPPDIPQKRNVQRAFYLYSCFVAMGIVRANM